MLLLHEVISLFSHDVGLGNSNTYKCPEEVSLTIWDVWAKLKELSVFSGFNVNVNVTYTPSPASRHHLLIILHTCQHCHGQQRLMTLTWTPSPP